MNDCVLPETPAPGVTRLVLNRPDSFNALSSEMLSALEGALQAAACDPACRVVVIAAGGKAFSAGHDLREMRSHPSHDFYTQLFAQCSRMMVRIQSMPQPVIAQVQGIATAAGCQLVSMCDLAVASEDARFAVSGINYGLFCATPSVGLSRNMHRKQAMEMLLTGDFLTAAQAQAQGLVNRVAVDAELDAQVEALVAAVLSKPREAVRMGKALFYKQREMGLEAAYQLAGQTMACNMVHPVAQEGVLAFIEKRVPLWP